MRSLLWAAAAVFAAPAAFAGGITATHTSQTVLGVDALGVTNERVASTVSMSGENLDVTSLPSLGAGTAGTAVTTTAGVVAGVLTAGAPFAFSESAFAGTSSAALAPTISNVTPGQLTATGVGDITTVTSGGTAGTLAGTSLATGVNTITAGGGGTSATITRSNVLSVFSD